jgi:formate dehydrogenase subunit delta
MNTETLFRMANQIAKNFSAYPDDVAVAKLSAHMKKFWAKRMLTDLSAYAKTDGSGLDPVAREVAKTL